VLHDLGDLIVYLGALAAVWPDVRVTETAISVP